MTRMVWGATGERFYESGVDRGVLYINLEGVPWAGLISVAEAPTGGEPRPFYMDGLKYLNLASAEEFEATITAFSNPPEFAQCDGYTTVYSGLYAAQQQRKEFGLSYRTMVGNDINGLDHGYKIHLVYNALAGPSDRSNDTVTNATNAAQLSWPITTLPPEATGLKPTAHLIIDSRTTNPPVLATVEDILYGSDSNDARLPLPNELMTIFGG